MIKVVSLVSMGAGWRPWFAPSCQSGGDALQRSV
jgi:hypothetical protein